MYFYCIAVAGVMNTLSRIFSNRFGSPKDDLLTLQMPDLLINQLTASANLKTHSAMDCRDYFVARRFTLCGNVVGYADENNISVPFAKPAFWHLKTKSIVNPISFTVSS